MDVWMPCASHEQHSECAACWLSGSWRISNGGRDTGIGSPSLNLNSRHISRSWATKSFHWRMRSQLKYSVLQMRRSAELLGSPSAWNTRSHRFNAVRKSLVGSAYRLWIRSASSRFSSGRSRGSCRLRNATTTSTAARVFGVVDFAASMTIRPKRTSIGIRASRRPVCVNTTSPCLRATAFSSVSSLKPSDTAFISGGSMKPKSVTSFAVRATPTDSMCSTTAPRDVRRISGSVNSGRVSKSSREYKRIAMPSAIRPQRPERWFALAWLIGSIGRRCTFAVFE